MSRERVEMHRLQELVRLHRLGAGCREVARLLRLGANQERKYRRAIEAAGLLEGDPEDLPELERLRQVVMSYAPPKQPPQQRSSVEDWADKIEKLLQKNAGPTAIWDKLRMEEKDFRASLWAVKRFCRAWKRRQGPKPEDVVIPVVTAAGEVAQVDFGYVGRLYDPERGVVRKAWVFVMVLGHSRHMFCRVVFDQKVSTWLELHVQAFEWFGGVVRTVVPDNLKAAVVKAAFGLTDDPSLNRSYRELARHYGFKIDPTPARQPRKKGKVESSVKYVKNNFFKTRELADIHDCNSRLRQWVLQIAGGRIHGTTGSKPLEVFEQQEAASLQKLPARRFEMVEWKKATVRGDGQFIFAGRSYPVPWRLMGKKVWVRATPRTVRAYFEDVVVASHERDKPVPPEVVDSYLPAHRSALRHRSRRFWVDRARKMGEPVASYIEEVFDSDNELSMLRTVQAMVTYLEKYPKLRARAACERARFYGNYRYRALKKILLDGLDMQPLPLPLLPRWGELSTPRFARRASELIQPNLEIAHEPG